MTTELLFRDNAYLEEAEAKVLELTPEGGLRVDRSVFYPTGGGQPGDSGWVETAERWIEIATAVKAGDDVVLVPAEPVGLPVAGETIGQRIDWARRYLHMRMHTALHLLSVVVPLPVTGGQVGAGIGRLDFDMPEPPQDVAALEEALNGLVAGDWAVSDEWITDGELDANPGLVKTLSVKPPRGQGVVRLVRIGSDERQIDLQPCGGTHVARTGEIGALRIVKVENKGKNNRRVKLELA